MAGTVVEYARFVEVQQRRARVAAELKPRHAAPAAASTEAPPRDATTAPGLPLANVSTAPDITKHP